jgi:hypothetical protein
MGLVSFVEVDHNMTTTQHKVMTTQHKVMTIPQMTF